jgi:hypothetical protein
MFPVIATAAKSLTLKLSSAAVVSTICATAGDAVCPVRRCVGIVSAAVLPQRQWLRWHHQSLAIANRVCGNVDVAKCSALSSYDGKYYR